MALTDTGRVSMRTPHWLNKELGAIWDGDRYYIFGTCRVIHFLVVCLFQWMATQAQRGQQDHPLSGSGWM